MASAVDPTGLARILSTAYGMSHHSPPRGVTRAGIKLKTIALGTRYRMASWLKSLSRNPRSCEREGWHDARATIGESGDCAPSSAHDCSSHTAAPRQSMARKI